MSLQFPGIRRICVFGVGGVGGYFGGRIEEWINNHPACGLEVYFVARGEHLQKILSDGITVKTPEGVISSRPALVMDDAARFPDFDLLLLCVKAYDLDGAVRSFEFRVRDTTIILPLLNGVDIGERIRANVSNGVVLPACLYLGTHIEAPGTISQNGGSGVIVCGKDPRNPGYSGSTVIDLFKTVGLPLDWRDDASPAIWEKFTFIAAFGLVSAASGRTLGGIMEEGRLRRQVTDIMREIAGIAGKKHVHLPDDIIEQSLAKASTFPWETKTSLQRDVEAGKQNEGDLFGGTIIREGIALGVPTPVTESVYGSLPAQVPVLPKHTRRE